MSLPDAIAPGGAEILVRDLGRMPYEAALADNHVLQDPDQPLEILRTIHSFDPCLACAVHVMDPDGGERLTLTVT